jgi:DNA-binding MarR family transcriptional regulator
MINQGPSVTLAQAGQLASTRLRQALAGHGLRPAQGHVLELLAAHGATGQQALLEALGIDPSVLVTLLNELERAGLAERRRDPADRRRHIVEITTPGAELVGRMRASLAGVDAELFADLTTDEIAQLHALLLRIKSVSGQDCTGD